MANITLGSGHQDHLFLRNGQSNTITDFKSIYFASTLDESQEAPPNANIAGIDGTGAGALNFAQTRFDFSLDINGIDLAGGPDPDDMTDMHIHGGSAGVSGGVIFAFRNDAETVINTGAGTVTGGWDASETVAQDLTPANVAALLGDDTYFNIHTNRDSAGFIRGQILKQDDGLDQIDLTAFNIGSFATLPALTTEVGGDAVITAFFNGVASQLTLDGVGRSDLKAGFFVFAGNASQSINGTVNRDDLFGAGGNDTVNGGAGNDLLFGENGADRLNGADGTDRLEGGLGNDTVAGGTGDDTITGGTGLDTLAGNAGADRFVFVKIAESGSTNATADRINDFISGIDTIDISRIDAKAGPGNQTFVLTANNGADGFTDVGQIRFIHSGNNTFIALNTTGTIDPDAIIRLIGNIPLSGSDFDL